MSRPARTPRTVAKATPASPTVAPRAGAWIENPRLATRANRGRVATDGSEDECEAFFYARHDANYNLLALVDEDGAIAERYEYTPYGQRTVLNTDFTIHSDPDDGSFAFAIGHQGLRHDHESGLVHNRARMLHTRVGRFVQRDPLGQDWPGGGYHNGMNLYQYVGSRPTRFIDPSGLRWKPGPTIGGRPCFGNKTPTKVECDALRDLLGKLWNAPNTALGLAWGGLGLPFGANAG